MAEPTTRSLHISLPGTGKIQSYTLSPDIPVQFDFDLSSAEFVGKDGNLEIAIEGGGTVVLENYQELADSGSLPSFVMLGGEVVAGDVYLFAFEGADQTAEDLETAAGANGGGSGAGEYSDDAGTMFDGLTALGGQGDAYASHTPPTLSGVLGNVLPIANDDTAAIAEEGDADFDIGRNIMFVDGEQAYLNTLAQIEGGDLPGSVSEFFPLASGGGFFIYYPNPPQTPGLVEGNVIDNDVDADGNQAQMHMVTIDHVGENHDGVDTLPVEVSGDDTVIMGKYGVLVVDSDGHWEYTLNQDWADVLDEGDTYDEVFEYTIADGVGGESNSATLTITVNGTNDMPVAHDDMNVQAVETGDSDGYTLHASVYDPDLGENGSLVDVHDEEAHDYHDASNTTVHGNVLAGDDAGGAADTDVDGGDSADGQSMFVVGVYSHATETMDYDLPGEGNADFVPSQGQTYDVAQVDPNGEVSVHGKFGTLTIHADGSYDYELYTADDGEAYKALNELNYNSEDNVDQFSYGIMDDSGAFSYANISFTVNGANDAPEAFADENSVVEFGIKNMGDQGYTGLIEGNVINGDETGAGQDTDVDDTQMFVSSVSSESTEESGSLYTDDNMDPDASVTIDGKYGTLTIHADGSYDYQLQNEWKSVQELNEDDHPQDIFNYTVTNAYADGVYSNTATLTITVNGSNDAPEATNDIGFAKEEGFYTDGFDANGNVIEGVLGVLGRDTDVDSDTLTVIHVDSNDVPANSENVAATGETSIAGEYGVLYIQSDGTYRYELNDNAENVQKLNVNDFKTDTFTYTISDEQGGTASAELTIHVNGSDDAPAAVDDVKYNSIVEAGVDEVGDHVAGGNVLTNDDDIDNAHSSLYVRSAGAGAEGEGGNATVWPWGTQITGTYGKLTIYNNGTYKYVLNDADGDTQALAQDEIAYDEFHYTVNDPLLAHDTATLSIQIIGSNDAAVIGGVDTGTMTEDLNVSLDGMLTADGTLTATDVDNANNVFKAITEPVVDSHGGKFTMDASGTWHYEVSNASVQSMGDDDSYTSDFTVESEDGTTHTVTVTVNGVNDAPVATDDAGFAKEEGFYADGFDAHGNVINGILGVLGHDSDVEGDPLSVTHVDSNDVPANSENVAATGETSIAGEYGILYIQSDGTYRYELNDNAENVQKLNLNDVKTDTFTYTITDDNGGYATAELVIHVNGSDDAPAAVDDVKYNSIVEAGVDEAGDNIAGGNVLTNDDDIDNAHSSLYVRSAGAGAEGEGGNATVWPWGTQITGTYGKLTIYNNGTYKYELNDADGDTQALAQDEVAYDEFHYTVNDPLFANDTATLSIQIVGSNDAAVIGGVDTGTMTEDFQVENGMLTADGTLTATDVDNANNVFKAITEPVVDSHGGEFTMDASGTWHYEVSNDSVQGMTTGEKYTSDFTVESEDGTTHTVTVTVNGVNDAPSGEDFTMNVGLGGAPVPFLGEDAIDPSDDHVSDPEDDYQALDVMITDLPDHGTLYDGDGNPVEAGDLNSTHYDLNELTYVPDSEGIDGVLLGSRNSGDADIDNWGERSNSQTRILKLDTDGDGNDDVVIKTQINQNQALKQYAEPNANHIGHGIANADHNGLDAGETITITFDGADVSYAEVGFSGLGSYFDPGSAQQAFATWAAYSDGVLVASGEVNNGMINGVPTDGGSGGDIYQTMIIDSGLLGEGVTFDQLVFGTVEHGNGNYSNWELSYVDAEFSSSDSFNYIPVDSEGLTDPDGSSTVTIDILPDAPVNQDPTAVDDSASVYEPNDLTPAATYADSVSANVLSNDIDPDNTEGEMSLTKLTYEDSDGHETVIDFVNNTITVDGGTAEPYTGSFQTEHGTMTIKADGDYTYQATDNTLRPNDAPTETFTYTMTDGDTVDNDATAQTADLVITVNGLNDAPVDVSESVTTAEDTDKSGNVLENASDADGDSLHIDTFQVAGDSETHHAGDKVTIDGVGTIQIDANGDYTFEPADNFNGEVPQITYTVSDGDLTDTSTLDIDVTPVNDAPVDDNETVSVTEPDGVQNTAEIAEGNVLDNTVDPDNDTNGDSQSLTSLTYTAADGTVTVVDFTDGTITVDGQESAYNGSFATDYGTLEITSDGDYTFTATNDALVEGYDPKEVITYTLSDEGGLTDSSTLTITVEGLNDAPMAGDDTFGTIAEGATGTAANGLHLVGNVGTNDDDVDTIGDATHAPDTLTYSAVDDLPAGVTMDANGNVYFDATDSAYDHLGAGETQTVSFEYQVADGKGGTDTATAEFTVTGTDDAPTLDLSGGQVVFMGHEATYHNMLGVYEMADGVPVNPEIIMEDVLDATPGDVLATYGDGADLHYFLVDVQNGATPQGTPSFQWNDSTGEWDVVFTDDQGNETTYNVHFDDMDLNPNDSEATFGDDPNHDYEVEVDDQLVDGYKTPGDDDDFDDILADEQPGAPGPDNGPVVFTEGDAPVHVTGAVDISDVDSDDMSSITITYTPVDGDVLDMDTTGFTDEGLTDNGDGTVTWTISGDAPKGAYEAMLQTLTFENTLDNPLADDPSTSAVENMREYTITVYDDHGEASNNAVASVQVLPVNDGPDAVNDGSAEAPLTMDEDGSLFVNVLGNDTDPEGDSLAITDFDKNVYDGDNNLIGTVAMGTDNQGHPGLVFTPVGDYNGPAQFEYTVSDGELQDTATVTIQVNPVNDGPDAVNDGSAEVPLTMDEDGSLFVNVLGNDTDPEGDSLTITDFDHNVYDGDNNLIGTVTKETNDQGQTGLVFTPEGDYNGPAQFEYTVSDGELQDTATVTIQVNPVNDGPDAVNDGSAEVPLTMDEDGSLFVNVLGNDTDPEGDSLTITDFDHNVYDGDNNLIGTVTKETNDQGQTGLVFTPEGDYNGPAQFEYTVSDGELQDTATVTIQVNPTDDPVTAVTDGTAEGTGLYQVTEDGTDAQAVVSGNVILNDTAPDGWQTDSISGNVDAIDFGGSESSESGYGYEIQGIYGTLYYNEDGTFRYELDNDNPALDTLDDTTTETFGYTATDSDGSTGTANLVITVNGVVDNTPPHADNDSATAQINLVTTYEQADHYDFTGDSAPEGVSLAAGWTYNNGTWHSATPTYNDDGIGIDTPNKYDDTDLIDGTKNRSEHLLVSFAHSFTGSFSVELGEVENNDTPGWIVYNGTNTVAGSWSRGDIVDDTRTWTFTPNDSSATITGVRITAHDNSDDFTLVGITVGSDSTTVDRVPVDGGVATGNVLANDFDAEDDNYVDSGYPDGSTDLTVTGIAKGDLESGGELTQDNDSGSVMDGFNGHIGTTFDGGGESISGDYGSLVIEADGSYTYTPYSTLAEGSYTESFTYQVSDSGDAVDYGVINVTANVVNATPHLVVGDATTTDGNSDDIISGSAGNDVIAGDTGGTLTLTETGSAEYLLVLDTSGSMGNKGVADLQDAVRGMVSALQQQLADTSDPDAHVKITLIDFDEYVGTPTSFTVTADSVTPVGSSMSLDSYLGTLDDGGSTNYEGALDAAVNYLESTGNTGVQVIFMSDGEPSGTSLQDIDTDDNWWFFGDIPNTGVDDDVDQIPSLAAQLQALATVHAVGVGSSFDDTYLDQIDSSGDASNLNSSDGLSDFFVNLVNESSSLHAVGDDTIAGGDGNDIIFGDGVNTDGITDASIVHDLTHEGDGSTVSQSTLDYVAQHHQELGTESTIDGAGREGGNDIIDGGDGNDIIYGMEGDDTIYGGAGDDIIHGGSGDDNILISSGHDTVTLGAGADTITIDPNYLNGGDGTMTVTDFHHGEDLFAIDNLIGSGSVSVEVSTSGVDNSNLNLVFTDLDGQHDMTVILQGVNPDMSHVPDAPESISTGDELNTLIQSIINSGSHTSS
ncbi:VCBS domain-containing protein [Pseudodesulfovibrio indicus]|uniref:VCBS domain-containing protein n=1 Tax=Pseudodesulfovibrio indicus TaxID=1716143 RepID=UPI0029314081|nr:Ig-like domain-containing protein [Pseudodesulfovibrio indicus]